MADNDPIRPPGPSFRDWCLMKARKWQAEEDARDRAQAVEFCRAEKQRYMRALEVARKGFHT